MGRVEKIYTQNIQIEEPFIDFASRFASDTGSVVLMSGGNLDCARYHILAARPWLSLIGIGEQTKLQLWDKDDISAQSSSENTLEDFSFNPNENIFNTLRLLVKNFSLKKQMQLLPITAGLFGYLSYDLKNKIENLPHTAIDDLSLPSICFYAPSIIVIYDKFNKTARLTIPEFSGIPENSIEKYSLKKSLSFFNNKISKPLQKEHFKGGNHKFKSHFSKQEYIEAIEKVKEYIKAGDIYQVNMSQRFETDFKGSAFSFFQALYKQNPAPFFSFVNGGNYQIVSTSPERFVKRESDYIETRPIKGTRPRGKNRKEDEKLQEELKQSNKDDAELSMIVDLMRNDIGKVCAAKSVKVSQHKRIEAYTNVYHLVSVVEGKLEKNRDSIDILKATFPGGSITGCPKIRSMEIIDELEPVRRHIYTGSIGYISFHNTMDFSIAIRTATIVNGKIFFSVGGGIVYDSDPNDEYNETLHKGKTLMNVIKNNNNVPSKINSAGLSDISSDQPSDVSSDVFSNRSDISSCQADATLKPFGWHNGVLKPLDKININISSLGFQYGYGFFETIRGENGKPVNLSAHIKRFNHAWHYLFKTKHPDISWDTVIEYVLKKNNLTNTVTAIKIIASKGSGTSTPSDNNLIVTVRPYTHRLTLLKSSGLKLAIYPHPRQTPLADYKTLNYLYYYLAGQWAFENNAHEALIQNPDGTISETNTGNVLLMDGKNIILPVSPHALSGIMVDTVIDNFKKKKFNIIEKKIWPNDFFKADQVLITNSLMGAVPAIQLSGKKLSKVCANDPCCVFLYENP